jgi:hypothetical protein
MYVKPTIQEKYKLNRHLIKHGDFILLSGTGIIASTIREADNSKMSHIGIVIEVCGRFLIVDSNARGNRPDWLSSRIESYNSDSDFCILRSTKTEEEISEAMNKFMIQSDDERTKYDFRNGIKELLNRAFGFKFKIKLRGKYHICSQSVRKTSFILDMMNYDFVVKEIVFPQDYLRYRNLFTTEVLFL